PPLPLDLVDPQGLDTLQIEMAAPPFDGHLDGIKDVLPGGVERCGDLAPTQALGPTGQEPGVRQGQVPLALSPRQGFDTDAALRALDPARGVQEEDSQAPERNELEETTRQGVVARPWLATAGAARATVGSRPDLHLHLGRLTALLNQACFPVHKAGVLLQDRKSVVWESDVVGMVA